LENRLDLFEDVVGPMRPVLNSIEGDIKTAVMGGGSNGTSKQLTDQAEDRAEAARAEAEKVGLEDNEGEEVTRKSLIRDAGLIGWGNSHHPALVGIGEQGRAYEPTVSPELMKTILTQSRQLESRGWKFTALRSHDRATEYPGTARGAYVLDAPDKANLEIPETATGTAQAELRNGENAVVTFDPAVSEEFSSIRLLLPGDPLFDTLIAITTQASGGDVVFICGFHHSDDSNRIMTESAYEATSDADVILPAIPEDRRGDLLEGTSLPSLPTARETVEDWLAGRRSRADYS
jgi:hypothetical protein